MDGGDERRSLVTRVYGGVSEAVGNSCALLIVRTACLVALVLAIGIAIALCLGHIPSSSAVYTFGGAFSGSGVTALAAYLGLNRGNRPGSGDGGVKSPSRTDQTGTTEAPGAEPTQAARSSRTRNRRGTRPATTGSVPDGRRPPGDPRSRQAAQTPAKTP